MRRKKQQEKLEKQYNDLQEPQYNILKKQTLKELIAPAGIDASHIDHLEIISNTTRYARSFFVSTLPRMCTFPELFREMYLFGDINTSVYINPVPEARSQNELNRVINQLETERIVAADRGNINRESILAQKRIEAEALRDDIASGFNKLFEASIVATLFSYNLQSLEAYTKLLATEMSKTLVGIKSAWAMQEEAFQSNLPLMKDKIKRTHTFDRNSMATVFPFTTSEVGHLTGIPLGINKQTGVPILFDNFHESLTNYNMVIFAKSGAGKSVTMKTLISRSSVLMGIESLALDAEGEYKPVADALGGVNVIIGPSSDTIINLFDLEVETVKDQITGKERLTLNLENKIEDVTQALVTMAKGSTRSTEVNELTKQIIAEAVADEYERLRNYIRSKQFI
ncbi:MAG: VirB4 family type IV secretion system protein [Clostridia bacterium]